MFVVNEFHLFLQI